MQQRRRIKRKTRKKKKKAETVSISVPNVLLLKVLNRKRVLGLFDLNDDRSCLLEIKKKLSDHFFQFKY